MWGTCDKCEQGYDDAKCWTLCPHPRLDDWDARTQIAQYKNTEEGMQNIVDYFHQNPNVVDTTNFQNKEYRSYGTKNQYCLDRDQLIALCDKLGLGEAYKTQRIILDIDTEGIVHAYTKAMLRDENFDIFNLLMSAKQGENNGEEN